MKKVRRIANFAIVLTSICLILAMGTAYASWYYIRGSVPREKKSTASISFVFPMPIGGVSISSRDELPKTSENLWGAADESGKVTDAAQARKNLLVNYNPFEIGVQNNSDDPLTEENEGFDLLISFKITFCLAPSLIDENEVTFWSYPFQDAYTISKNGEVIGSGNIYYPFGEQTSGNVELEKGELAFKSDGWLRREYYYYTAVIEPDKIDGFDVEKFVVAPSEDTTSFVIAIAHEQDNDTACFASIEVIVREYTP